MIDFLPEFREFLIQNRVFITVVGFLMSEEIRKLTRSVVDNLIEPILDIDLDSDGKADGQRLFQREYRLKGMTFKIGVVLRAALHFVIMVIVAFLISKLTRDAVRTK